MSESLPKLQPCPCGKTPARVCIEDTGQGGKWANVTGACCGEWAVEFRTNYHDYRSPECEKLAIDAWNEAPRADQSRCAEMEAKLQSPLQRDGVPTVYLSGAGLTCTHRLSETDLPVWLKNTEDTERFLKLMEHLVERERTAERMEDWCDLMVDEFKRIAVCPGVNDEIKGLCERAISNTKQRVPVIEQRDRLEAENAALREVVTLVRYLKPSLSFALKKHGILTDMGFDGPIPANVCWETNIDVIRRLHRLLDQPQQPAQSEGE